MSPRLSGFLAGALFALLAFQASAEGPVHAVKPGQQQAACVHCHDNPHGSEPAETARFDACASCHVEEHFAPSTFDLARHATLSFALEGKHTDVECSTCHFDPALTGLPNECAGCHVDRHRGLLGETCTECHAVTGFKPVEGFDHGRTGFALTGPHASPTCADCHQGGNGENLRMGKGAACNTCHTPGHGDFGRACDTCHTLDGKAFATARQRFDHRTTGFPLERRHASQPCISCHARGEKLPDARCSSCHLNPHAGQLGGRCADCHEPDRWSLVRFDHDATGFALRGAHFMATCTECHTAQRWIGLTDACFDCHAQDAGRALQRTGIEAHRFGRTDCSDCHNVWRWGF